jgi:preprotein translocase subunit YajC
VDQLRSLRADPGHLLFPDPHADEAAAEEDKVVTTSGIYGQITRVNDKSVQVQIADKVRIEVARASVGGYQGQEPVVPEPGNS